MPEGDTIFRSATTLRLAIEGCRIDEATSVLAMHETIVVDAASLVGHTIVSIEARGKHLLMHLSDGRAIHSHMGMTGSWHIYREGDHWLKPREKAALLLVSNGLFVPCFFPATLEILSPDALRRHEFLRALGPDYLAKEFDELQALARFRANDRLPIGEAVMDQRIACGVGNIYKSEVLFLTRTSPFKKVGALGDDELLAIIRLARKLLRKNQGGSNRQTRFGRDGGRLWMYGRSKAACFECGGEILVTRQGGLGRTTYYCPACQKP